jgi:hypothetical protein
MRQVTREEFFKRIYSQKLDVHPTIVSGWPYTSNWTFHNQIGRPLYGKTVLYEEAGQIKTHYHLA